MVQFRQDRTGNLAIATPDYERSDGLQRDIVNHGISVQESSNTMAAVEYMKAHDVNPAVIERVLLEPARRRSRIHH